MILDSLIAYMQRDLSLYAYIGSRIYHSAFPKRAAQFPLVVWQRVSTPIVYAQSGSRNVAGIWQFTVWSRDGAEADTVATEVMRVVNLYADAKLERVMLRERLDRYEAATMLHSVLVEFDSFTNE